ncbi:MAG: EamA family transporter RarD [FCB group bacterium]|nr:EamA family transporter RarD [FCB group bacterium]
MNSGIVYAIMAYLLWGLFPIFWKVIKFVSPYEILCHRIIWSFVFLAIILTSKKNWKWLKKVFADKKTLLIFAISSLLLAINWLLFIYAVNSGYIIEASLGYFINPLFSVFLGVVFLKERPRIWQWVAFGIAAIGVLYLTFVHGSLPWIGLSITFTFGIYGLLRKTDPLSSTEGLTINTMMLFIPAFIFLLFREYSGVGSFGHIELKFNLMLILAGAVTSLPLIFFASAAKRIALSSLGILQYIAPILQFCVGYFLYKESLDPNKLIGFVFVWIALMIYTAESIIDRRKMRVTTR